MSGRGFSRLSVEDQAEVVAAEQRRIDWAIAGLIILFVAYVLGQVFAGETKLVDEPAGSVYLHPEATVTP